MTTTLEKNRTVSIIVALENDGFNIKQMLFTDGDLMEARNWPVSSQPFGPNIPVLPAKSAGVAAYQVEEIMRIHPDRAHSVFITVSAAKRMTDEQVASIQAAALETRT